MTFWCSERCRNSCDPFIIACIMGVRNIDLDRGSYVTGD